jgi:predicted GTPase
VTLQTPDWSSLYRDIDFINRYKPRYGEELNLKTANILLFGDVSSGKSSFINSAYSVISNRLEFVAPVSGGREPTTVYYERYPLLDLPIELRDTWGWSESNYKENEIKLLLDGALPNKTHMNSLAKGQVTLKKVLQQQ